MLGMFRRRIKSLRFMFSPLEVATTFNPLQMRARLSDCVKHYFHKVAVLLRFPALGRSTSVFFYCSEDQITLMRLQESKTCHFCISLGGKVNEKHVTFQSQYDCKFTSLKAKHGGKLLLIILLNVNK